MSIDKISLVNLINTMNEIIQRCEESCGAVFLHIIANHMSKMMLVSLNDVTY